MIFENRDADYALEHYILEETAKIIDAAKAEVYSYIQSQNLYIDHDMAEIARYSARVWETYCNSSDYGKASKYEQGEAVRCRCSYCGADAGMRTIERVLPMPYGEKIFWLNSDVCLACGSRAVTVAEDAGLTKAELDELSDEEALKFDE